MPLARISVPNDLSDTKIRGLADAVHAGLVATCQVPLADRFQLIFTLNSKHMHIDPNFPDVNRTPEASIIEILFLEGRTIQQKAALFEHIAAGTVKVGFVGDDITIALTENAVTDWSLGNGKCFGPDHGSALPT